MHTTQRLLWIVVALLLLGGCGPQDPATIHPVQHDSGYQDVYVRLTASTNCAERGETITFTFRLENTSAKTVTFTADPPLEIILEQKDDSAKQVRWSASDTYPQNIPAVLQPDEILTYEWRWTVPVDFQHDPTISGYQRGVTVRYRTALQLTPTLKRNLGAEVAFSIGVEYGQIGYQNVSCSSYKR